MNQLKTTEEPRRFGIIFYIILGVLLPIAFVNFLMFLSERGDKNTYYTYKDLYYYCDEEYQWSCLNQDDEWTQIEYPRFRFPFFEELPISMNSDVQYVIGDDIAYKYARNVNSFYEFQESTNEWEKTQGTKDILAAFDERSIINTYDIYCYFYDDNLFLINDDDGSICKYSDDTHTFEKTDQTLDTPDFIRNERDYIIENEDGFYLYDDTVYYSYIPTYWKTYHDESEHYYKWEEAPVDKELILNWEKYYLCGSRNGYYQFEDALCYLKGYNWYTYQNKEWIEINPNELAKYCSKNKNCSFYYEYDPSWRAVDFAESKYGKE